MIFVGYELGSAAYRCYNPITKMCHWSNDEAASLDFDVSFEGLTDTFQKLETVVMTERFLNNTKTDTPAHEVGRVSIQAEDEEHVVTPPQTLRTPAARGAISLGSGTGEQDRTPPSCNLDADHGDSPLKYRGLSDILGQVTPPGRAINEVQGGLFFAPGEEPTSFS
jgi:hypothetical protein